MPVKVKQRRKVGATNWLINTFLVNIIFVCGIYRCWLQQKVVKLTWFVFFVKGKWRGEGVAYGWCKFLNVRRMGVTKVEQVQARGDGGGGGDQTSVVL